MLKLRSLNRRLLIAGLGVCVLLNCTNAFARDRHDHHRHHRYHYRDGRYYRSGWFGLRVVVDVPPVGAFVDVLPFGYRTIVYNGRPYYYFNNVYYTSDQRGYVVVPAPEVQDISIVSDASTANSDSPDSVTIHVPNRDGSFTPVILVKQAQGYIGPQGEYYPGQPTVAALKALYGK